MCLQRREMQWVLRFAGDAQTRLSNRGWEVSIVVICTVRTYCRPLYEITPITHEVSRLRKHDPIVEGMRVVWNQRVSVRVCLISSLSGAWFLIPSPSSCHCEIAFVCSFLARVPSFIGLPWGDEYYYPNSRQAHTTGKRQQILVHIVNLRNLNSLTDGY